MAKKLSSKARARRSRLYSILLLSLIVLLPMMAGGWLVLSPLIPLNLVGLAQQWPAESIEHRRPHAGCGLNQRPPDCQPITGLEFTEEEVTFAASSPQKGLANLRGTLTLPVGAQGPRPAVLLVAGSGPTARDAVMNGDLVHKLGRDRIAVMKEAAAHLAAQGFAVLRYDKRSCTECYKEDGYQFSPEAFRFSDFTRDAQAALDYLGQHPRVDPERLVVLGHSQGAHLVPLVAQGRPGVVAVVMWAGHLRSFEHMLLEQFATIASLRLALGDLVTWWTLDYQREVYAECFDKLRQSYNPDEVCIGGGVTQAALKEYAQDSARLPQVLADGDLPSLYVLGNVDRNIAQEDFALMAEALKGRDAELHRVQGVSHMMMDALGQQEQPALSPRVLELLDGFLGSVGSAPTER
jgi:dienelactone hydrolase